MARSSQSRRIVVTDAALAAGSLPHEVRAAFAVLNAEPLPDHATAAGRREQERRERAKLDVGGPLHEAMTVADVFHAYDIVDLTRAARGTVGSADEEGATSDDDDMECMDAGIAALFDRLRAAAPSGVKTTYVVFVVPGELDERLPCIKCEVVVDVDGRCLQQDAVTHEAREHLVQHDGIDLATYVFAPRRADGDGIGTLEAYVTDYCATEPPDCEATTSPRRAVVLRRLSIKPRWLDKFFRRHAWDVNAKKEEARGKRHRGEAETPDAKLPRSDGEP